MADEQHVHIVAPFTLRLRPIAARQCARCGNPAGFEMIDKFGDAFAYYCVSGGKGTCGADAARDFARLYAQHGTEARAVQAWGVHEAMLRDARRRSEEPAGPGDPAAGEATQ